MRKNLIILFAVTALSLIAATLGHAYCREFCMLFKPITWPFIALGVMLVKGLMEARKGR